MGAGLPAMASLRCISHTASPGSQASQLPQVIHRQQNPRLARPPCGSGLARDQRNTRPPLQSRHPIFSYQSTLAPCKITALRPTHRAATMNRRKKINQILKANAKKANAKLAPKNKNPYISKADRLKLAEQAEQDATPSSES